eukprot:3132074-Alexandrium_andersonii.AAC.1
MDGTFNAPGASRAVPAKKRIAEIAARIAASRFARSSSLRSGSRDSRGSCGSSGSSSNSTLARITARIAAG